MNFFARGLSAAWRHPIFEFRPAHILPRISSSWGLGTIGEELGRSWRTSRRFSGEFMFQMVIGQAIMNVGSIDRVDFQR